MSTYGDDIMSDKPILHSHASLTKSPKRILKSVIITTALIATTASTALLASCSRHIGTLSDSTQSAQAQTDESHLETLRARRAEVPSNVNAIMDVMNMHNAIYDSYVSVEPPHPLGEPGPNMRPWDGGNTMFNTIGWAPGGEVRGTYSVSTTPHSTSVPGGDFVVTGICDVDGDGVFATYTATKSIDPVMVTNNDIY
jgi:hypothetical protein